MKKAAKGNVTVYADTYSEDIKEKVFKKEVEASGKFRYVPLVANHFGGWSTAARLWIARLGRASSAKASGSLNNPRGAAYLFTRLSVIIQTSNFWMIDRRRSGADIEEQHYLRSALRANQVGGA